MSAVPQGVEHVMRPMAYADIPEIMAIELRAYPFPWTDGIFRDCLRVGYSCWVFVHPDDGRVDAYGVMSMAVGEGHLLNLCVRPECQGQGLGRRALRALLDKASQYGVETMFLEVRPSNAPALRLYLSEGFNEVGTRRDYYPAHKGREDAVVLARQF